MRKGIFYQILNQLAFLESFQNWFQNFLTTEFFKEFQNPEYEVHQVGSNEAGSQNFRFLALITAELAALQISFKNRRQRRVTDGKKFALNSFYLPHREYEGSIGLVSKKMK
jgi:hypothetical protein